MGPKINISYCCWVTSCTLSLRVTKLVCPGVKFKSCFNVVENHTNNLIHLNVLSVRIKKIKEDNGVVISGCPPKILVVRKLSQSETAISLLASCDQLSEVSAERRPVARAVRGGRHPPSLAKGPLLTTKWAKNGVFVGGLKGWGEVQKVHFLGPKCPLLGGSAPPQIRSWLWAWLSIVNI